MEEKFKTHTNDRLDEQTINAVYENLQDTVPVHQGGANEKLDAFSLDGSADAAVLCG